MSATRLQAAAALREIATLLAARGDAPFRARAYRRGAEALEAMSGELGDAVRDGRLTRVPGIGSSLAAVVVELHRTGRSGLLERLRSELPAGMLELQGLPGLSPAKVRLLDEQLGVRSLSELREAAESGRLQEVKGFGPATARKLLAAIEQRERGAELLLLADALEIADALEAHVGGRAQPVGALRRGLEEVPAVEMLASGPRPAALLDALSSFPQVAELGDRSPGRARVRLASGARAELYACRPEARPGSLLVLTGSAEHLGQLAARAAERGLRLGAEGLVDARGRAIPAPDEAALYAALDLPYVPPELRDGAGEVERAARGESWDDLVEAKDVRGLVHCHTVYSDGRHTVEQMARAADALGMEYLTVTDHSPTAFYARGVEVDRLKRQWDEIAKVQETVAVRLLRGTESDILEDGALDYPASVLEQLDVVIASVHNRHKLGESEMTRRVVTAMRQPVFKVWGHALGRLLQKRPPFAVRIEKVLDAIAGSPAAIEVNGDPRRLDMEPRYVRLARERGIPFVLSTDAHSTGELRNVRYAAVIARRGGLRRGEVLNTRPVQEFVEAVRPARGARG